VLLLCDGDAAGCSIFSTGNATLNLHFMPVCVL
jgi:hypothetical protein